MKRVVDLEVTSTEDLVRLYRDQCIAFSIDVDEERIAALQRRFDAIMAIEAELKRRPGDQRKALTVLLGQGNLQARLMAATALLAIDREAAISDLEELAEMNWMPQTADARLTLRNLAEGRYIPS